MQDKKEVLTMEQLHEIVNEFFENNNFDVEEDVKNLVYEVLESSSEYTFFDKNIGYFNWVDVLGLSESESCYNDFKVTFRKYLQAELDISYKNLEVNFKSKVYELIKDKEELEDCSHEQFIQYQWHKNGERICRKLYENINSRFKEEVNIEKHFDKYCNDLIEIVESKLTDEEINYLDNIHEAINNYCDANFMPSKLRTKINQIFEIHFGVATGIIRIIHSRYILNSDANLIVDSRSQFFERKIGIKPIAKEFISFLRNKWFAVNSSEIKRLLHEFMVKEELENNNYFQDAKNIFQQTLSIETTSATVEKGKENKRCLFNSLQIAIAVTMVNEKTGQFPKTISKTDKGEILKFLKDIEREFKIENVPERFIREYNRLTIGKDFFQNISPTDKEEVKKILEIKPYTELLKGIK